MGLFRLDRLLSNMGYGSRKECRDLVAKGLVLRSGVPMRDPEEKIEAAEGLEAQISVKGEPMDPPPGFLHLLLNKPTGYSCSHQEEGALIYDLLPPRWKKRDPKVNTVGRLDKDTSGLLLLTDNGPLLHRLTSPKVGVNKTYSVTLARPLEGHEAEALSSGKLLLRGEEKPLLPVEMIVRSPLSVSVVLQEGRYHQVRRMFAALGNHVESLHRERIGGLAIPGDLPPGGYSRLTPEQLISVWS